MAFPIMDVAIVGAGPAGLFAAEVLSAKGLKVCIFERLPSPARKFLLAGRGGLNLTHSESSERFVPRYGASQARIAPLLQAFTPDELRAWAEGLGQETFVGSSGRVFPRALKASPLLRAWLRRLADQGVELRTGHHWQGWSDDGALRFKVGEDMVSCTPRATLLALGGASWPRLGSDGGWVKTLEERAVGVESLRPSNCGFKINWSEHLQSRFAGEPLKRIALACNGRQVRGEAMLTQEGIEGGAVYALSADIRDAVAKDGHCVVQLDLRPDLTENALVERLSRPRGRDSFANAIRKQLALPPVSIALLHEVDRQVAALPPLKLARLIKALPLTITGVNAIDRAISSAGGVRWSEVDDQLMLKALPGVFCAGEMLDWEAPTGGYLLQGSFAIGAAAAKGILNYLAR
ncbi:MAG: TIGR03862 family flavoprotein [Beijerinckiaceae bacterium]